MDINRAKMILFTLAEGVDPTTGEVLSDDSVCNKGEVVRALYTILNTLDTSKPLREIPENAGKPWSADEDAKLKSCFASGMSKKELCALFKRTPGSISSRLAKLGIKND